MRIKGNPESRQEPNPEPPGPSNFNQYNDATYYGKRYPSGYQPWHDDYFSAGLWPLDFGEVLEVTKGHKEEPVKKVSIQEQKLERQVDLKILVLNTL